MQQIATACGSIANSRFILAGNGGLPLGPENNGPGGDRPWSKILPDFGHMPSPEWAQRLDMQPQISVQSQTRNAAPVSDEPEFANLSPHSSGIVQEATGMAIAPNGEIQLLAANTSRTAMPHSTCPSN